MPTGSFGIAFVFGDIKKLLSLKSSFLRVFEEKEPDQPCRLQHDQQWHEHCKLQVLGFVSKGFHAHIKSDRAAEDR